ncbi:hypothetical protein [Salinivibrio kushneri]|uniref:hypothetical protein n=1 Tax=Salinivibrio kushneri TaxID=1908198 RepID=UPI0009873300|nr:hypothetical protein [Salinivibrio kushneri]OOE61669.1 hypothetical protein BZG18_07640 [Salinivibrio kushneri]
MERLKESPLESIDDMENVIKKAEHREMVKLSSEAISKRHGALKDAARLQALVSIARNSAEKVLVLQNSSNTEVVLQELCSYAPGLTSVRLNKSISINNELISRRKALLSAIEKMIASDNQRYADIVRGRSIDLCCVSGAERQYLSPLFSNKNSQAVRDTSLMKKTMVAIFKQINQREFNHLEGDLIEAFGIFGCELFKNTQEHALKDQYGNPYIEHVEGMIASWKDQSSETYEKDFMGHPRLSKYWNDNVVTSADGTKKTLRCMEVSFFDTGPGLVGRAFGTSIDTASEKDALIKCIGKNFSTKSESGAGNGYPTILNQLSKVGGLIRIRSGNQCLFNCFDKDKHGFWTKEQSMEAAEHQKTQYLMNFDNWTNKSLGPTSGTVVSILVPLRKDSGQRTLL